MTENEIAKLAVDGAYKIHTKFGPGLLESAYEALLEYELKKRGLDVTCQQPIPIVYEEIELEVGYRADVIVEGKIILELKAVEKICTSEVFQAGTIIVKQDKGDKLYVIEDGLVGIIYEVGPLSQRQVQSASKYDIFGWSCNFWLNRILIILVRHGELLISSMIFYGRAGSATRRT